MTKQNVKFKVATIYHADTGVVAYCQSYDEADEYPTGLPPQHSWIEGRHERVDTSSHTGADYFEYDVIIETNKISNIPPGTEVFVDDYRGIVDDGEVTFSFSVPRTVNVVLNNPIYRRAVDFYEVPCEPN